MNATDILAQIEAIRALKARYFRHMDNRDWDQLTTCFTPDLEADFRGAPGMLAHGRDDYMAALKKALAEARTIHHGHMPEITIIDEQQATGIWAMDDIVEMPGISLRGWGHYHETYRYENNAWYIAKIRLQRLRLLINGEEQVLDTSLSA